MRFAIVDWQGMGCLAVGLMACHSVVDENRDNLMAGEVRDTQDPCDEPVFRCDRYGDGWTRETLDRDFAWVPTHAPEIVARG